MLLLFDVPAFERLMTDRRCCHDTSHDMHVCSYELLDSALAKLGNAKQAQHFDPQSLNLLARTAHRSFRKYTALGLLVDPFT